MKYLFLDPEVIIPTPQFAFIMNFLKSTGRTQVGWHYFIDLAWIYSQVKNWPTDFHILDAGGGKGPTQFLLTELGFNVTNIDLSLEPLTLHMQQRYNMKFHLAKSYQATTYVAHLEEYKNKHGGLKKIRHTIARSWPYQYISSKKYQHIHERWRRISQIKENVGRLNWMKANLCDVPEIPSDTFDAVVSLSALEHIPIELLPQAWGEITRICKPGAKCAITTSATEKKNTWFHNPSKGYCFSDDDLKMIFGALPDNSNQPAKELLEKYRSCTWLKDNLAPFYKKSGKNGMPWGKWKPKYIPVGLHR